MEEQQKKRPAGAKQRPAGTRSPQQQNTRPRKKRPAADAQTNPQNTAVRKKRRPADAQTNPQNAAVRKKRRPADAQTNSQNTAVRKKRRPAGAQTNPQNAAVRKKQRPAAARTNPQNAAVRKQQRPAGRAARPMTVRSLIRSGADRARSAAAGAGQELKRLSTLMFAVFAVIYIIVLALVIRSAAKKAHTYLGEYESTRPQYVIEAYVASLDDTFFSEMVAQAVGNLTVSQYETLEMLEDAADSGADGNARYSYQKTADFSDSRPSYYILRNEEAVAAVSLDRSGWTEVYSFPVWRIGEPESVLEIHAKPAYTVSVTVPQGASVRVNGVKVPQEIFVEAPSELQLTTTEQFYMNQPLSQSCEISGLFRAPTVEAVDADGNVLEPETMPDPTHAQQEYVFAHADTPEPDQNLLQFVDGLTHAYMNYVMNTQCAIDANLAVLSQYLLPGSTLSLLMQKIYSDVWYNNDSTMREDHVYEVRHVRMYADNVCTVDVHLESTFGRVAVNDYVGTVRWVLVNNGYGWQASNMELLPD